jgi:hypothetical protein
MKIIVSLIILSFGYYTFTYGISLWRHNNKLGSVGVTLLVLLGTIGPIITLFIR